MFVLFWYFSKGVFSSFRLTRFFTKGTFLIFFSYYFLIPCISGGLKGEEGREGGEGGQGHQEGNRHRVQEINCRDDLCI